jgi:carbon monoxide dehydrogenase subunit G
MSQTNLQSQEVAIAKPSAGIYNFLTNLNNFQKLMPSEVSDWQSTVSECTFTLKGMPSIGFMITDQTPETNIVYKGIGKLPAAVFLKVAITPNGDEACKAQLFLEAELNPMLKMMVEKPLTKFLDVLAHNLTKMEV